ncbi:MAG: transglycosylase domain-containing protein, partial [Synergistaceae bacterium]|nr:transglycosylase domain-containing protein [Synergistaceae bacterium]
MMKKLLKFCLVFALAAGLFGVGAFAWLWASLPLDLRRVRDIDGSTALYDNEGRLFHLRLSPASEWQIPIPLSEMGRWLPLVAVGAEDGRFYRHPGVDPLALLRAAAQLVSS